MDDHVRITGTLVNSYFICKRKAWLYSRQFNPDPEFDLLVLGRLVSAESFKKEKKEIVMEGMKIDIVKREDGEVVVGEIKKSQKAVRAAFMQLSFYLFRLKSLGLTLKGELLFPVQKRKIHVELSPEIEEELVKCLNDLENVILSDDPPPPVRTGFCKPCAFFDFCFS
ncbi:MAG: CRISPR-associated protein Cas4 [Deltaproteobacteria bacterium]|nr:CRISPR-associated protein Cas4 [Deltaproteobacteria bacterium]